MLQKIPQALAPDKERIARDLSASLCAHQPHWYASCSPQALQTHTHTYVERIFSCMKQGSLERMDAYICEAGRSKLDKGMNVRDVVQWALLCKNAFLNAIRRRFAPTEGTEYSDRCGRSLQATERFFDDLIVMVAQRYSDMLLARLNAEHRRNKLLLDVSRTISSALDPDTVLERLAQSLASTIHDGCCTIFLVDPETGALSPRAGWGYDTDFCMRSIKGMRLCPNGNQIRGRHGESYGFCTLNPESLTFAEKIPQALRDGWLNIFPIANGETMLGVAMLSSRAQDFRLDEETAAQLEAILGSVAVTIENAANAQRTQRKLKESESLRRVANRLLQQTDSTVNDVFHLICEEARVIVGGTSCALLLREEGPNKNTQLVRAHGTGSPQPPHDTFTLDASRYGELFRQGKTAIIKDAQSEIPAEQRGPDEQTLIVVPLVSGEDKLGLLLVFNKLTGFDRDDTRIMEMFAAQAVLALRNARLAEQNEMLAVAGERQRLARELHDSVTQALYAANLCADAAARSLQAGKTEGASNQLQSLRGMTRQAMRDMRSLIFDLHPPELESEGLVGALQSRLNSVEGRSGLNPELQIRGEERRLPLSLEEELFRMSIEALNNTAKHSRAEQVHVRLEFSDKSISLHVADNGQGFTPDSVPSGGMGLRGMTERAERIRGSVHIESAPGKGTKVHISAPLKS
jgi:signal transduction histidine kinase